MMNFRKIAAAPKGRRLLRYFTEDTPEPIHPPPVDAAGRQLEEGGRLTAYHTGRDSRATCGDQALDRRLEVVARRVVHGCSPRSIAAPVDVAKTHSFAVVGPSSPCRRLT
jgi:hypothetical protein